MTKLLVSLTAILFLGSPALADSKKEAPEPQKPHLDAASTQLALDLLQKITDGEKGNIFFSPYSVQSALAMTSLGAKGDTLKGMIKSLRIDSASHETFAQVQKGTRSLKNTVSIVNKIWPQKGAELGKDFLQDLNKFYSSKIEAKDYVKAYDKARIDINTWVSQQTKNRIKDLLPDGSLSSDTRMVLTNAVYFKGQWMAKFDEKRTREADFTLSNKSKSRAMMMNRKGKYHFYESESFSMISMPYVGNELSMIAILPNDDSIEELGRKIEAKDIRDAIDQMNFEEVQLSFPRFKQEFAKSMKEPLIGLGMEKAFSGSADFTRMMPNNNLYISDVFHKAFIENNEVGTEAAAATAVVMMERSIRMEPMFIANRPFIYMIVHNETGRLMFLGRMMDASK